MGHIQQTKNNKNTLALSDIIWNGEVFAKGVDPNRQWNLNMVPPKINAAGMHLKQLCRCSNDDLCGFQGGEGCSCFGSKGVLSKTKTLYLSMNDFDSVEGIERFRELRSLSLSDNFLRWVPRGLRLLPDLRRLNMAGNPFEEWYWREKVLFLCPRLVELDGRRITDKEREVYIRQYRQACMLWNVLGLVQALVGILSRDSIDEDDAIHVAVGSLLELKRKVYQSIGLDDEHGEEDDTLEFFYCALKRATDGCLAIVHIGDDEYPCVSSSCGNMVASCVDTWRKIGWHPWEDEFHLLELVERLRYAWEDGDMDEVERVVFEMWSEFYVFASNMRIHSDANASVIGDTMHAMEYQDDVDEIEEEKEQQREEDSEEHKIEQCIAEYARLLAESDTIVTHMKDKNKAMEVQNKTLKAELEAEREATHKLCMDKEEISVVVRSIQQSLEESKQDRERLQQTINRMQYEFNKQLEEKEKLQEKYQELKRLHIVVSDEAVHRLEEQRRRMLAMEKEIEVLKRQPIVPLRISIISPDVTNVLESKDGHISVLQQRVDDLEMWHSTLERAHAFRSSWDAASWQRGLQRSFRAWRDHCHRKSIVDKFGKRLSSLYSRMNMKCIFDALLISSARSKRIDGIVSQRQQHTLYRIIMAWKSHVSLCRMVRDFVEKRLARTKRRALDAMHVNHVEWKYKLRQSSAKARQFHNTMNQKRALSSWVSECNVSKLENSSKLHQHAACNASKMLRQCLLAWKDLAEDKRLDERAIQMYRCRTLKTGLSILREYTSYRLHLRDACTRVEKHCVLNALCRVWSHWRHAVHISREEMLESRRQDLRRILFSWRSETKKSRQSLAMQWQCLYHWRVHAWDHLRSTYATQNQNYHRLLLSHYFTRWKLSRMNTDLEHANAMLQTKDLQIGQLTSLCNSSSVMHRTRERNMKKHMIKLKKELSHTLTDLAIETREAEETMRRHKALESQLTLRLRAAESIKTSALTRAQLSQHENIVLHSLMTA